MADSVYVARNRRCMHCGTRARTTSQQMVAGFKVRLCLGCWFDLLDVLDKYCQDRDTMFPLDARERHAGDAFRAAWRSVPKG